MTVISRLLTEKYPSGTNTNKFSLRKVCLLEGLVNEVVVLLFYAKACVFVRGGYFIFKSLEISVIQP